VENIADNPAPATPGQALAEARERQGLSRGEIAQRLHMSPFQVEALEAGDYERLPKGTFLRGFVRNYAKLVGIAAEPLVAGLTPNATRDTAPRIVVPSQNIRFEPLHERISSSPYVKGGVIAAVVLAFGLASFYWFTEIRGAPPVQASAPRPETTTAQQIAAAPLPPAETPPPVEAPKLDSNPAPQEPASSASPAPGARGEAPKAPASTPAPANPASKAPAPLTATPVADTIGGVRLAFAFRGDSWVEVKDGSGKLLMSRLNPAGSAAQVAGKPPLSVVIGNASTVSVRYNDRDFPLEPHTRVAVARFTVE
jgi:cytoskeleton protein RodZ